MLSLLLFSLIGFAVAACESELPRQGPDVGTRFMRGIQGEGSLYVPSDPRPVHPSGFSD
jgi:hypothetical protein